MGLDTVELLLSIEKEFNIHINDNDAAELAIVGDIARHIVKCAQQQNQQMLNFETVLRQLIHLLQQEFAIPDGMINSTSHVIDDLGLD